jgi:hypothetical protein
VKIIKLKSGSSSECERERLKSVSFKLAAALKSVNASKMLFTCIRKNSLIQKTVKRKKNENLMLYNMPQKCFRCASFMIQICFKNAFDCAPKMLEMCFKI